jgi:TonB-linked SusC/RagA family outer membrane protein
MKKTYLIKYVFLLFFVLSTVGAFAQTGSISGKVVDEANQPLPGATVTVKGTQITTGTDANGKFLLRNLAGTITLEVTFVGYQPSERVVTVSGNVTEDFGLQPSAKDLNEVVVIGYGTVKKKDLTGSISTVTEKDFNTGAITTPEQLIQGKVAGVSIISNGGAPGGGSQIRIRGGASVNGSNDPLIVIDGVPLTNDAISGAANPLDLINPNDIESFSILKDASAAAIYGNRASNGVILITTKKGKAGKPVINFSTQFSISTLPKEAPVLSPSEFRSYVTSHDPTGAFTDSLGTANTDWQKVIYQTSYSTDDNISLSGTTGILPYRVSVGYTDQNGILKTTSLERYSTNVNLSPSFFTDHLKVDFNFIGSQEKQRFANNQNGVVGNAVDFNPTVPVYSGNSSYGGFYEVLSGDGTPDLLAPRNPLGLLEQEQDKSNVYRAISSLALDYKLHFFPDLHAHANFSYDGSKGTGIDEIPATAASQYPGTLVNGIYEKGNQSKYDNTIDNKLFEGYLSYGKDFKSIKSHVDAVAGYSDQTFTTNTHNFPSYYASGVLNAQSIPQFALTTNQYDLTSVYARVNYGYDDKYLLTGTIRSDVSTRFAPGIRTGNFPSVAAGWVISHEDFMKNNSVISNLKLRAEYGVTGNQDGIGDYEYLSDYGISGNTAQYQLGNQYYYMYRPGPYYPGRTWEQTATSNLGLDYGFLNDRITGTIDYYYRKTKNLLANITQPAGTNFSNQIIGNVGNMTDKGLEFNITGSIISTKDINWTANVNFTLNRNKITNLTAVYTPNYPGLMGTGISGGTGHTIQIDQIGYPKNSFYVLQQVYGPNGKPLDGVFVDKNNDGTINNSDLYIDHSPDPQEYFGFSSDFNYKKWNIGFVARAELGNYVYDNIASNTGVENSILNNTTHTVNNGSSMVLQSNLTGAGGNDVLSDYYIENGSFFRMDNMHIGYNFGKVFKNTGDLKASANVQNVFIITKYQGVDPEITNGVDNNNYPRPRTFVLGLNLSL